MDDKSYQVRIPKRWARVALIIATTALIVAPLTAIASHSFTDVPDTNTFHADIAWLADAGVTKGCNPPANTEFCPNDDVSRGQMSAFMRRFAQYIDAEDGTPGQADNADKLDGKDSTDYETVVAMKHLSFTDGTDLGLSVTAGAYAGPSLEITVPAAGIVLVQSASSWDVGTYQLASWTEVDTATPCDAFLDGDVMPGSFGTTSVIGGSGTTVGQGNFSIAGAGTHTVHMCFFGLSVPDGGTDLDYSITGTWIPSGSATVAAAPKSSANDNPSGGFSGQ